MHNLDINFLRDRGIDQSAEVSSSIAQKKEPSVLDKIPLAAGLILAFIAPAITFGYLQSVKAQTASVNEEIQQLETQIADLGNQNRKIEAANADIKQVQQETAALVGVFEKIKPWAAIMQEVSDRTPPGVQVDSIQQSGSGNTSGVNLAGTARSYDDVNDFVLFLKRSPFFDSKEIKLNGANLSNFPWEVENEKDLPDNATLKVPQGIKYTISAQLNNVPSSQLIKEINEKGSFGVVTRLKTLERKGAILK